MAAALCAAFAVHLNLAAKDDREDRSCASAGSADSISCGMSDTPPTPTKIERRIAALARRTALGEAERSAAAQAIAVRGLPFPVRAGSIVAGYSPIRSEIDPIPLMQHLAAQGARLALPVTIARDEPLMFRIWSPSDALVRGSLGIPEPAPEAPQLIPDILLVPLAAFDRAGHRIGYGAGHYDRTFAQLRAIKPFISVGVAFDTQEIEAIPMQPHDVALDYVLTETRTIDFRSI
jgi:5-formyltetrahydrofolate cyclo-ligase